MPTQYRYTLTPIEDLFAQSPETDDRTDRRTGLLAVSFAVAVALAATIGVAILVVQLIHGVFVYFA